MSVTIERHAPPVPENSPSDEELRRIVYGEPTAEDDPDEIIYRNPHGAFFTTRAEREKAARIWQEEGQVAYPHNTEKNLELTERMLRLRLTRMGINEIAHTAADQAALTQLRVQRIADIALARQTAQPDSIHTESGHVQHPQTPASVKNTTESKEYSGRHHSRRFRIPLAHLLRRRHTPKHAA